MFGVWGLVFGVWGLGLGAWRPGSIYGYSTVLAVIKVTLFRGTSLIRSTPPVQDPTVSLCLGTYGEPTGLGVSYEQGTPAARGRGGNRLGKVRE